MSLTLLIARTIWELVAASSSEEEARRGSSNAVPVSRSNAVNSSSDTRLQILGSRNKAMRVAKQTESSGMDMPALIVGSPQDRASPIKLFERCEDSVKE